MQKNNFHFLKILLFACVLAALNAPSTAFSLTCQRLFEFPLLVDTKSDLIQQNRSSTRLISRSTARDRVTEFYNTLVNYKPPENANRARSVTQSEAHLVLEAIRSNEVTGSKGVYDRPDVSIGYCFGRAMFAHLLLLRMGVQKESIMKVWAVGPMRADGSENITWGFHVATAVFTRDAGWVLIDTGSRRPTPLKSWISKYEDQSLDKKVQFYVSDANKMSINLGSYSRAQLGLNLERENDWYKGYFRDALNELRTKNLTELGVKHVRPETAQDRDTFAIELRGVVAGIRDFFGL